MSIGNGAPAWPSVIVSNGGVSPSDHRCPTQTLDRYDAGRIADESAAVATTLPDRLTSCSLTAGWTSLLVRTFESPPSVEPFETAASPDQLVVLVTRGRGQIESFSRGAWRAAVYRPGVGGLTAGGQTSRLRWQSRTHEAIETVHIFIPCQTMAATIDAYRRAGSAYRADPLDALLFDDPAITRVGLSLVDAIEVGAPDLYAQSAAQFLATHLLSSQSRWPSRLGDERRPGILSDRRLRRVLAYMDAAYMEPLSLDDLAREAGVSRFHFARLFRARVGIPPPPLHRPPQDGRCGDAARGDRQEHRGDRAGVRLSHRTSLCRGLPAAFLAHTERVPAGRTQTNTLQPGPLR